MIKAAANVGIDMRIIRDVERIDQEKRGIFINGRSGCFIRKIVTTKLIAPRIEEIPKIFNPKIHISAAGPGARKIEYGGYAVQLVSAQPNHTRAAPTGIIQKATALSFGHAMSLYLTIIGIR
jgi:hypothetical protein